MDTFLAVQDNLNEIEQESELSYTGDNSTQVVYSRPSTHLSGWYRCILEVFGCILEVFGCILDVFGCILEVFGCILDVF